MKKRAVPEVREQKKADKSEWEFKIDFIDIEPLPAYVDEDIKEDRVVDREKTRISDKRLIPEPLHETAPKRTVRMQVMKQPGIEIVDKDIEAKK